MNNSKRHPLSWIPSLYFVEGLPYIIVAVVSLIMFKRFGLSDTESAAYSAWLSLPWVIKPLWSPIVEMFKTKRWWILTMQALMSMALSLIAFSIPTSYYVQASLALFFLIAFSSATHDISADGFYMTALDEHDQAQYVGIRSTFYRLSTIFTEGLLLMYIGNWEVITRNVPLAWSIGLGTIAILLFLTAGYHLWALPKVEHNAHENEHRLTLEEATKEFGTTFLTFFQKPMIGSAIIFMLFYRLPEALLTKIFPLFLTAKAEHGGLALTTQQFGFAYGTVGVIGLTLGGILGGMAVARHGFLSAQFFLLSISLLSAHELPLGKFGDCSRTIWLRLRIYTLYAFPAILCSREIQSLTLRTLHWIHGVKHDNPRFHCRMDSGPTRLLHKFHSSDVPHPRDILGYFYYQSS